MILLQPQITHVREYEQLAKEQGLKFELMDLSSCSALDNIHLMKELCDIYETSLLYSCHGVFADLNFSGSDPLIFEASKQRLHQCASMAARMGIGKMVVHSCFHPVLTPEDPLYERWCDVFAELLRQIAVQYQLELFVENVLDLEPGILKRLMGTVSHPCVNVCLDIGHANLQRCSLEEWFLQLHPYLRYVHLSDNGGVYDEHLPVGKGTVDWLLVKRLVAQYDVQADYTLEVGGVAGAVESISYLKKMWGELF